MKFLFFHSLNYISAAKVRYTLNILIIHVSNSNTVKSEPFGGDENTAVINVISKQ